MTNDEPFYAVDKVSFTVKPGEIFGLVGESGCGKSVLASSILKLLPTSRAQIDGNVFFENQDLLPLSEVPLQKIRGKKISMIFQEAGSALSPVFSIGFQLIQTIRLHDSSLSRRQAHEKAIELLARVGLPDPANQMKNHLHELSGGMRQRALIAHAISAKPQLLIADEPTTALDVIIQDQILDLLRSLTEENNTALILITHDLKVVANMCDSLAIMKEGKFLEQGPVNQVLQHPQHPYTRELFSAISAAK